MTAPRARTTRPTPDPRGLPPPLDFELRDAERVVGWVRGHAIGFRGFDGAVEAVHAAWVAHRALARRLAQRDGRRPIPIDTEPLALQRRGDDEHVLASGQPIAILRRPAADDPGGDATFGFELRVPAPADELSMRSLAYVVYRALRKSGVKWAMWVRDRRRADHTPHAAAATATARPITPSARASRGSRPAFDRSPRALGVIAMLVLLVVLVVPTAVGVVLAMATLGALALTRPCASSVRSRHPATCDEPTAGAA